MKRFLPTTPRFIGRLPLAVCALWILGGCTTQDWLSTRTTQAEAERTRVRQATPIPEGELTLESAIAYALDNNLDTRLMRLQQDITEEARTGRRLGMLPSLQASARLSRRDEFRASTSESLETGRVSLEPSYSSEKKSRTAQLQLMWSLLDFGVSYVRAQQSDKQLLLARQQYRRMQQNLVLEVARIWYRAAVHAQALREARQIMASAEERLATIRRQVDERTLPELEGLDSEETLLQMRMRIQNYAREQMEAEAELLSLMGAPPQSRFVFPALPADLEKQPPPALDALEIEALKNRPELWEGDLEVSLATDEVRVAALSLLPNPVASLTRGTDRNKFLAENTWWEAGVDVAWDLLSLPRAASEVRLAKRRRTLAEERRALMAAAVLVQTRLALARLETAHSRTELAEDLAAVRTRRLEAIRKRHAQGQARPGEVLDAEAQALFARIDALQAAATVRLARRHLDNAVGRAVSPPVPTPAAELSID